MRPEPYLKQMEAYQQFLGLNTVDAETYMEDSELTDLLNIDLIERGALRRRSGIVPHKRKGLWSDIAGKKWGDL